jgi:multidrug transporter EmrE-like cation transporter
VCCHHRLDLAGTVFAKEWAIRRAPGLLLIGLAVHAVLFTVYAISMRRVPMTVVTAVWCALVLIAVPLIDWLRYGTRLGADRCSAVALIMVAGTYSPFEPTPDGPVSRSSLASERHQVARCLLAL